MLFNNGPFVQLSPTWYSPFPRENKGHEGSAWVFWTTFRQSIARVKLNTDQDLSNPCRQYSRRQRLSSGGHIFGSGSFGNDSKGEPPFTVTLQMTTSEVGYTSHPAQDQDHRAFMLKVVKCRGEVK